MAAVDQLRNPATWQGDHDEIILALNRATNLKDLLQTDMGMVQTPFWDDASDVGDDAPDDAQIWYGQVADVAAPPAELTWFENTAIWVFTGLLAFSGTPAAAIAFRTIAPKFVIAQKAGDVGEVIRIVVDAQDVGRVDTTGRAGQIIETPIVADPDLSTHQIYLIKAS